MQIFSNQLFAFSSNGASQQDVANFFVNFTAAGATAVIEGIDVEFANRNDHHLGRLQVDLFTEITGGGGNHIVVRGFFGLRDWSGGAPGDTIDGDDPIKGQIRYSVIVA